LTQQRMTLSDLEWPFHTSRAISAVTELFVSIWRPRHPLLVSSSVTLLICRSDFVDVSQSAADTSLLRISGSKRPSFYFFQFQFWPFNSHRHVILHLPTKFPPNQTTRAGVITT